MLTLGIGAAALATATLSGIFGMGGGMILMGILAMSLPIAAAMILHAVTQLGANGYRALLLARHIRWAIAARVGGGGLAAVALFWWLQLAADRAVVLVALGALPLAVLALPRMSLSIERPRQAFACGALFTGVQLIAGASGPILDAFFLRGRLGRFEIVATKAAIAVFGHLAKLVYWALLLESAGDPLLAPWVYLAAIAGALAGTRVGRAVLERISEHQFRRGSILLIAVICGIFLSRGVLELML